MGAFRKKHLVKRKNTYFEVGVRLFHKERAVFIKTIDRVEIVHLRKLPSTIQSGLIIFINL